MEMIVQLSLIVMMTDIIFSYLLQVVAGKEQQSFTEFKRHRDFPAHAKLNKR